MRGVSFSTGTHTGSALAKAGAHKHSATWQMRIYRPSLTRGPSGALLALGMLALAACGPNLGGLEKGETGKVERAFSGDTLVLDSGLRVFLAEIDAPQRDQAYAREAQAELEALVLHRPVQIAYGGERRWTPRARESDDTTTSTSAATAAAPAPRETAVAHVFVQSEGGRWIWLQRELVSRGAAFVRPRRQNHTKSAELLAVEAQAREAERGLWQARAYKAMSPQAATGAAAAVSRRCSPGGGPLSFVEGRIDTVYVGERRASFDFERRGEDPGFSAVVFGQSFAQWDGAPFASFRGARVRVRGSLGMFNDRPQICIDDARQIELLAAPR